uniref:hAT-like transposase RNase-H fold domain-containing protein n=1 Tax=Fagus sylvatica TaxID=28930 RepID=A0A2N9F535_FAGSY
MSRGCKANRSHRQNRIHRTEPHLLHRQLQMPVPFIGKEDHPTDWYGVASGDGLLRPPANRTAPIQASQPPASLSLPLCLFGSQSLSQLTFLCSSRPAISKEHPTANKFNSEHCKQGETIGKVVEKCLKEWGIDIVLTITVDNASSNDVAIDYLRRKMKLKESCIVGCEFLHMRCCAHILNLIVQDGLKDIHESIAKVRNAMRWNSTYLMLEAAEKFERAFDRLIIDDEQYMDYFEELDGNGKKPKGPPRSLDWENAWLLCIQNELYKLCNLDGDSLLKKMAEDMKMKYEKYWGNIEKMNLLLFVAVVLDPRYKMKYIVYWFNKWYDKPKAESMVEKVRGAIDRLYAHYATEFETASLSATVSASGK